MFTDEILNQIVKNSYNGRIVVNNIDLLIFEFISYRGYDYEIVRYKQYDIEFIVMNHTLLEKKEEIALFTNLDYKKEK